MNTTVTADMIKELNADDVFVATGSTARRLQVEGADSGKVITAVEALRGEKPIGQKVVVIGGGLTGIELAYSLTKEQGKEVFLKKGKTFSSLIATRSGAFLHSYL